MPPDVRPDPIPVVIPQQVPAQAHLLDVREPAEWLAGHIPGSVHVPMMGVPAAAHRAELIPTDRRVYVVCRVGARSGQVAGWLREHGYDAVNVVGGLQAWAHAGLPLVSENGQPPTVV